MSLETVNPQEQAQKIWDEIEAEEAGKPATEAPAVPPPQESTQPTAQEPAAQADSQPQAEISPDAQALLDRLAGLEAQNAQLAQRLRNAEGHIGGLKQQLQAAKQVAAEGGDAPSAEKIRAAQSDPAAMAALKQEYPEFAEAIDAALKERVAEIERRFAEQHKQQPTAAEAVTPEELQRLRGEIQIEVRHPGWQDTVKTPEFHGWLRRQPREVQLLAASESPQDAVRLLDLHAESRKPPASQRTQRLESAAALPVGRPGAQVHQKSVDDMTPQEYWRYLDEQDRLKKG